MTDKELKALRTKLIIGDYAPSDVVNAGYLINDLIALRAKHEAIRDALQRLYDINTEHIKAENEGSMWIEVLAQLDFVKDALK